MHRFLLLTIVVVSAAAVGTVGALKATCVLQPNPGSSVTGSSVTGAITMQQASRTEQVHMTGVVNGLPPGEHGWHVHEFGDLTNGCLSAGGHYNPLGMQHGGPDSNVRHAGDFGNLAANGNGQASIDFMDPVAQLYGGATVIGRAIVVHEKTDDLGRGGDLESAKTGNAGGRLACCVIGVAPDVRF